jgi:hypothetical protein
MDWEASHRLIKRWKLGRRLVTHTRSPPPQGGKVDTSVLYFYSAQASVFTRPRPWPSGARAFGRATP